MADLVMKFADMDFLPIEVSSYLEGSPVALDGG